MVKRFIWFFSVVALLTSSCGLSRRTASKPAMAASDDGRALTLVSSTGRPILTYNYTETPAPAGVRKVTAKPFLREKTGETLETLGIAGETIRMELPDCEAGDILRGPVRNHRR